jgi:peptidoglycan/xylan/chitin deacetylase (PgdA/CDA1 family)
MRGQTGGLVVLGYHNVEGTACFPAPAGSGTRGLERQLRFLRRTTTVVPLHDALQRLADRRPLPPRAVAITFDDGYRDNLTLAGPMLRELGLPATCFLVPEVLSGTVSPWWERLAAALDGARADQVDWGGRSVPLGTPAEKQRAFAQLSPGLKELTADEREAAVDQIVDAADPREPYRPEIQFLDWSGARRLRDFMAIGSHSLRHSILSRESAQEQERDLDSARRQLSDGLDVPAELVAYPNGTAEDYTADTVAAARRAGHTFGITTEPGWNTSTTPRYEIRRTVLLPQRGAVELGKVVRDVAVRR